MQLVSVRLPLVVEDTPAEWAVAVADGQPGNTDGVALGSEENVENVKGGRAFGRAALHREHIRARPLYVDMGVDILQRRR